DVIQHIIISHHGIPEFGAIKTPATPEAIAVHMIENMDAKLMTSLHVCRGDGATAEGNWTEYNKSFGGRLYRPDVAPAEAEEQEQVTATPELTVRQPPAIDPGAPLRITNPLFDSVPARK